METITSENFETIQQIHSRVGGDACEVVDAVKREFQAGLAICAFEEIEGRKTVTFRKKPTIH